MCVGPSQHACVSVCVCGLMCCSGPLGCLFGGLATRTTGVGKKVRMKGVDPGREGRIEGQGKEKGKRQEQE